MVQPILSPDPELAKGQSRSGSENKPEEQEPEQELAKGQSWSNNQLVPVLTGAEPGSNTQIYKFQSKTCL